MDTPTHHPGTPAWVDATVDSLEAHEAWRAFFTALFGWRWDVGGSDVSHYAVARDGERAVFGLTLGEGAPGRLTTYFATGDADSSLAAAVALGARPASAVADVGDLGRTVLLEDPVGASVALWEAGTFAGFGVVNEAGAPGWFDHHSDDPAAAAVFYRSLLGHGLVETGDPTMSVIADGDRWFASFSPTQGPEQGPAAWNPIYLGDSLERVREVAVRVGGSVLLEEMAVPGGAICVVAEPTHHTPLTVMRAGEPAPAGG